MTMFFVGAAFGAVALRALVSMTRDAKTGSIAHRIHIAVVGPWRPK